MAGIHRKTVQKKIFMTQIITLMWSLTESQTSWNVKSSGPSEASLQTKLVEVMKFHLSYFKSWKMMLWKCCTQYASTLPFISSTLYLKLPSIVPTWMCYVCPKWTLADIAMIFLGRICFSFYSISVIFSFKSFSIFIFFFIMKNTLNSLSHLYSILVCL